MKRLFRRYHSVVWWVVALHAAFGLCFIFLIPTYRGPDEAEHVDMTRQYPDGPLLPDPTQHLQVTGGVNASIGLMGPNTRPRPRQMADEATPRPARPSFDDLDRIGAPGNRNQLTQHPPLYYATEAGTVAAIDALRDNQLAWDTEVLVLRLVSWLATLALPLLAAEGALAAGLGRESGGIAAGVTLCVPMATFVGAIANNDSFVMVAAGAAAVGALGFARHGGWRFASLTALGCATAPLSKSTGAPAVVWAALVVATSVAVMAERRRVGPLSIIALGILTGGSWHLRNLVVHADPQPNGFGPSSAGMGADTGFVSYLPDWVTRINASFWGQPGRNAGVTLPDWTFWILGLVALGLLAIAVVFARPRWPILALAGLVTVTVAILIRTNYRAHLRTGALPGLQGRYLFPLLVPIAMLVAAGAVALLRRRAIDRGPVGGGVAAIGVGLHLVLGWSMLAGYWGGDGPLGQFASVRAWSALPETVTIVVFAAAALTVIAATATATRALARPSHGGGPSDATESLTGSLP